MNNNWKTTKILKIKITEMELFSETESKKKKIIAHIQRRSSSTITINKTDSYLWCLARSPVFYSLVQEGNDLLWTLKGMSTSELFLSMITLKLNGKLSFDS